MRQAQIRTACECQADLVATLDEQHLVLEAAAIHPSDGTREVAPAHTVHPERSHFDVGWLCPYCGRNTLRSFHEGALTYREVEPKAPSA